MEYSSHDFLKVLGIEETGNHGAYHSGKWTSTSGKTYKTLNPTTGKPIAEISFASVADYHKASASAAKAQVAWRDVPAPQRGEVLRHLAVALRAKKEPLSQLLSLEMGKILTESRGEIQECIDVLDFAVGLSRAINGQVIPSERPGHVILERWNPIGVVGVITAFNFPAAVAYWNLAIALMCGNSVVWKGATTTSLVTLALAKVTHEALISAGANPDLLSVVAGPGSTVGEALINDPSLALVSFTGSCQIGERVSEIVHKRFGKTILELGGNNAVIVMPDADLDMAVRATFFGAVGTAGQRCTSTRRLIVHEDVYDEVVAKLVKAYTTVRVGNPLDETTLLGPVHTVAAVKEFTDGVAAVKAAGGTLLSGGDVYADMEGRFVQPTIFATPKDAEILKEELFVPILHVIKTSSLDEAIAMNNNVPQGLSSALFTQDMQSVFKWTGPSGSDCGLVNVNIGTSGAEIGGAFGGEKATGGGRESGSDSWKQYMRRQTCTVNHSKELPLAQGVSFE